MMTSAEKDSVMRFLTLGLFQSLGYRGNAFKIFFRKCTKIFATQGHHRCQGHLGCKWKKCVRVNRWFVHI
jgi:hypothetical protein